MKTKTDSFTKFITFCVLALFLFTNMILFSSCDNGNSPNDNTNEEQNNNVPTDYCEICDGVQTENCGIEHKCNDENCVEYAAKKIYKNGHTHDYCENNDCDGSTHKNQAHPEYESWFQEAKIGGENSPIKIRYVNLDAQPDSGTAAEKNQDRVNQYKKYIESFTINSELSNVKLDNTVDSFDALIGSTDENSYYDKNGINDICKPAIEEITKNVAITDEEIDLDYFYLNYRAFENEVYGLANDKNSETYTEKKAEIEKDLDNNNKHYNIDYSIYQEDGTIHPNALQRFNEAIKAATTKLKKQGKNVTEDDLYNIINLSLSPSAIRGTHDCDASSINHSISGTCTENEMVDVIYGVDYEEMAPIAQAKLNKLNFSQDYGRELC